MSKTFCENCKSTNDYLTKEEKLTGTIKGKTYFYNGKNAYCKKCHKLVYVHEINDHNLERLYDQYRQHNNIISLDKIKEIPEKYGIGKRPLSLLLGWGEITFSRFYDGDIPTIEYSETLKEVYYKPSYFNDLLEKNKELLKDVAYKKSKDKVNKLLKETSSKIGVVADYITKKCDVTNLTLQKLLYYIQGFYYAFYETFIFNENCKAWQYGPVYGEKYYNYKHFGKEIIDSKNSFELGLLSEDEISLIDSILKCFACYGGSNLIEFTHHEKPWLETKKNHVIKKELIASYFVDVKSKYNMKKPKDIHKYSEDMFKKYKSLQFENEIYFKLKETESVSKYHK